MGNKTRHYWMSAYGLIIIFHKIKEFITREKLVK